MPELPGVTANRNLKILHCFTAKFKLICNSRMKPFLYIWVLSEQWYCNTISGFYKIHQLFYYLVLSLWTLAKLIASGQFIFEGFASGKFNESTLNSKKHCFVVEILSRFSFRIKTASKLFASITNEIFIHQKSSQKIFSTEIKSLHYKLHSMNYFWMKMQKCRLRIYSSKTPPVMTSQKQCFYLLKIRIVSSCLS